MDGLSTASAIAGVISMGISISKALYDLIATIRDAPKAMKEIARSISDTAVILRQLRRILREREDLFKRRLLKSVDSAVKRIHVVHGEVLSLVRRCEGVVSRVLWAFQQSRVSLMLAKIEGHKSAIGLMLHTMMLAVQLHQIPRKAAGLGDHNDTKERSYLRREAEVFVQATHQSLLDLAVTGFQQQSTSQYGISEGGDGSQLYDNQIDEKEASDKKPNDTASWLYETVFASLEGSSGVFEVGDNRLALFLDSTSRLNVIDSADQGRPSASIAEGSSDLGPSNTLIKLADIPLEEPDQRPVPPSPIVNQLLSEWTNLAENRIEEVVVEKDDEKEKAKPVTLKDKAGRKFIVPYHKCNTWAGMEAFIKEAFAPIDATGLTSVKNRWYDLIGSTGEIIVPSVWEDFVEPGCEVKIITWTQDFAYKLSY